MKYRIGDEIVLKVNFGPSEDKPRYERRKVLIIGAGVDVEDDQYLCYVPHYLSMPHLFKLNRAHQRYYLFEGKFLGEQGCFITEDDEIYDHIPAPDGAKCGRCKSFVRWAEYDDEGNFTCRRCRINPYC